MQDWLTRLWVLGSPPLPPTSWGSRRTGGGIPPESEGLRGGAPGGAPGPGEGPSPAPTGSRSRALLPPAPPATQSTGSSADLFQRLTQLCGHPSLSQVGTGSWSSWRRNAGWLVTISVCPLSESEGPGRGSRPPLGGTLLALAGRAPGSALTGEEPWTRRSRSLWRQAAPREAGRPRPHLHRCLQKSSYSWRCGSSYLFSFPWRMWIFWLLAFIIILLKFWKAVESLSSIPGQEDPELPGGRPADLSPGPRQEMPETSQCHVHREKQLRLLGGRGHLEGPCRWLRTASLWHQE